MFMPHLFYFSTQKVMHTLCFVKQNNRKNKNMKQLQLTTKDTSFSWQTPISIRSFIRPGVPTTISYKQKGGTTNMWDQRTKNKTFLKYGSRTFQFHMTEWKKKVWISETDNTILLYTVERIPSIPISLVQKQIKIIFSLFNLCPKKL